jgi:hypothetical protein
MSPSANSVLWAIFAVVWIIVGILDIFGAVAVR